MGHKSDHCPCAHMYQPPDVATMHVCVLHKALNLCRRVCNDVTGIIRGTSTCVNQISIFQNKCISCGHLLRCCLLITSVSREEEYTLCCVWKPEGSLMGKWLKGFVTFYLFFSDGILYCRTVKAAQFLISNASSSNVLQD